MNSKIKFLFLGVLFFAVLNKTQAQQDPMFTKYFFNTLNYNPAYAGSKEYMSIVALAREQWVGWGTGTENGGGAPSSQTFSIHTPIMKRVGVGLNVFNDNIGATKNSGISGSYAYRIPFGESKLSLGLSGGISYWRADWSQLTYRDPRGTDPVFSNSMETVWVPQIGAGAYFYHKYYYFGISAPRLFSYPLRPNDGVFQNILKTAQLYPHYYLTSGAAFRLRGDDLVFRPSILIKNVGLLKQYSADGQGVRPIGAPDEFDIDLSLFFYEKLWIGAAFRSTFDKIFRGNSSHDSVDMWATIYLKNGLRVGMAYDFPLTELNNYTVGSFELMLGYDFDYVVKKVTTPRYF